MRVVVGDGLCRRGRPAAGHAGRVGGETVADRLRVTDATLAAPVLTPPGTRRPPGRRTGQTRCGWCPRPVGALGALRGVPATVRPRSAAHGCSRSSSSSLSQFERSSTEDRRVVGPSCVGHEVALESGRPPAPRTADDGSAAGPEPLPREPPPRRSTRRPHGRRTAQGRRTPARRRRTPAPRASSAGAVGAARRPAPPSPLPSLAASRPQGATGAGSSCSSSVEVPRAPGSPRPGSASALGSSASSAWATGCSDASARRAPRPRRVPERVRLNGRLVALGTEDRRHDPGEGPVVSVNVDVRVSRRRRSSCMPTATGRARRSPRRVGLVVQAGQRGRLEGGGSSGWAVPRTCRPAPAGSLRARARR